ncbi:MAG: hypothetical protein ACK6EB_47820, partial [Planctomyces sp.]
MSGLYGWLRQTWSSLVAVADMNEPTTATEPEPVGCEIFTDALEQAGLELDEVVNRIGDLMSQFWECRKAKAMSESVGTEDG